METTVLSFDQAGCMGYSHMTSSGILMQNGAMLTKNETKDSYIDNYNITKKFICLIEEYKPTLVTIENTFLGKNVTTLKKLTMLQGMLIYYMMEKEILFEVISPSTWQSYLGHKSRLTKQDIADGKEKISSKKFSVDYANSKFGLNIPMKENDRADAICQSDYARMAILPKIITKNS